MAPAKPDLRWASRADRSAILALLVEMHADVGVFPLSHARLEQHVDELLQDGMILLAFDGATLVGSVGLYGGTFWYSDEKVLMDTWVFASPRAKDRLAVFRRMMAEVKEVAKDQGTTLVLTLFCERDNKRKSTLFSRYGEMLLQGFKFVPLGGDYRVT